MEYLTAVWQWRIGFLAVLRQSSVRAAWWASVRVWRAGDVREWYEAGLRVARRRPCRRGHDSSGAL